MFSYNGRVRIEQNRCWHPLKILIWGNFDDRFSRISRPARVRSSSFFNTIYRSTLAIDPCHRFPAPTFGLGVGEKFDPNFLKNGEIYPQNFSTARCLSRVSTGSPSFEVIGFTVWGGVLKKKSFFSILRIFSKNDFFLNLHNCSRYRVLPDAKQVACRKFFPGVIWGQKFWGRGTFSRSPTSGADGISLLHQSCGR